MLEQWRKIAAAVLGTMVLMAASGDAANITINNPSFESILDSGASSYNLPTGAYTAGLNSANVVDLSSNTTLTTGVNVQGGYVAVSDPGGVYDDDDGEGQLVITGETGENVGYLNGTSEMYQPLSATLQAGTYTLKADIGYPVGTLAGSPATGDLQLRVGSTEVAVPVEIGSVGVGSLANFTRTYTIPYSNSFIGQQLRASVLKTGGGTSLYFDNFSLDFVPSPTQLLTPLDTATAVWQFDAFTNPGTNDSNMNVNRVVDITNGLTGTTNVQSDLTRNLGANNPVTVGNVDNSINALNSDHRYVADVSLASPSTNGYLARDLGAGGNSSTEELVPDPNTSYTVFARVRYSQFNLVDDAIRVGDWNNPLDSYALEISSGQPRFTVTAAGSTTETQLLHNTVLVADKWYDITGVFESLSPTSGKMTLYLYDPLTGLPVGSPTTLTGLSFGSLLNLPNGGTNKLNLLVFSTTSDLNGHNVGGRMDLAAVWNFALNASQVAQLSAVPEPSTFVMLLFGMAGMWLLRRR